MSAYEYVCQDCKKEFTAFFTIKEYEANPKVKCPHCGSDRAQRKLTGFFARTSKESQARPGGPGNPQKCTLRNGRTKVAILINHGFIEAALALEIAHLNTFPDSTACIIHYHEHIIRYGIKR